MRNKGTVSALAIACAFGMAGSAMAANHVRVDTMSFVAPNTTCTIGVYVENDIALTGFVLPLEIRTWDQGAYMAAGGFKRELNVDGRVNKSPLGVGYTNDAADTSWPTALLTNLTKAVVSEPAANTCNRGIAGDMGNRWNTTAALPDFVSPDAILFASVSQGDPNIGELISMPAGSDPEGTPSYQIICNVGPTTGIFIVDTTCVSPANHLSFVNEAYVAVTPTFQHGIVGVNVLAGIKEVGGGAVPESYMLEQNYPNPFNAGTVIRFAQPVDGDVRIDVYNILGRKVKTLVNEFRSAGTHQADWDGRSDDGVEVATGVYFYRITTDKFSSTRKMVLLK